jgi:phosphatidylserine decarboxylase
MNKNNILSPVDATIQAIDIVKGKYKIYCDVGLCDGNSLLAPIDGSINIKFHTQGLNLSSHTYKAQILNNRATIKFNNLSLKLLAGVCSRKIKLYKKEKIKQCEAFGKFYNGIAIIKVSNKTDLSIQIGDKIKAGQTIIGKYNG